MSTNRSNLNIYLRYRRQWTVVLYKSRSTVLHFVGKCQVSSETNASLAVYYLVCICQFIRTFTIPNVSLFCCYSPYIEKFFYS